MKKAASLARQAAAPISDIRGSADHRRELVEELCFKALEAARERAQ
jgi:CO/xanthine dehydrogenase FAD-binding subunit